mmetsp:Transcript_86551/g.225872  ORF Transcript_86551/g.225872 Transcript_86551/m.225872 type:complete len:205 (-) Transcript_86551:20-634(-)
MHFGPPLAAKEVVSCTRILATLQRRPSATASSTPSDAGRRRCRHRRRCRPRHRRLKRRRRSCPSARSGPAAGTRSAMQQCQSPWHRLRRWVCERRKAVPMPCGMAMPTRCSNFGCSLRSLRRRRRRRRNAARPRRPPPRRGRPLRPRPRPMAQPTPSSRPRAEIRRPTEGSSRISQGRPCLRAADLRPARGRGTRRCTRGIRGE